MSDAGIVCLSLFAAVFAVCAVWYAVDDERERKLADARRLGKHERVEDVPNSSGNAADSRVVRE